VGAAGFCRRQSSDVPLKAPWGLSANVVQPAKATSFAGGNQAMFR
jgi:hypothetical protein